MPESTGNIRQTESASNSHKCDNWKAVGDLARALVQAMADRRAQEGNDG